MRRSFPISTFAAVVITLTVTSCTEPPTSLPPASPLTMELTPLFSGGEGVLVSESFRSIDLAALTDSLGQTIARRWSNFRVLFDGDTVDSWRVSEDRIAFRVPPSYSGSYEVAIRTATVGASPLSARVIGAVPGYGPYWACSGGTTGSEYVPIGPEELLLATYCGSFQHGRSPQGVVRITPGRMIQQGSLIDTGDWTDELSFDWPEDWNDRMRSMWAAGPSFRAGHAVVERYPNTGDSSSTWVWKFASNPEPVEPIDCLPPEYGWGVDFGYTAAEIAPGVCLSMVRGGDFYLSGSERLADASLSSSGHPSFRVSSNGTTALRSATTSDGAWPVFRPGVGVAYTVQGYLEVKDVAFSPSGDSMYVTAWADESAEEDAPLVLDVRKTDTGVLLNRLEIGTCKRHPCRDPAAVARDADHLWTLRWLTVDDDRQLRVELRDPGSLSVRRSVAIPEHLYPFFSDMVAVASDAVLVPDATGRRAYIVSGYSGHAGTGYMVELY